MNSLTELKDSVDRYLQESEKRSLSSLSRASGIPYTTVRRIAQGEGQPTYRSATCLLMITTDNDTEMVCGYLEKYFPDEAKVFSLAQKNCHYDPENLGYLLEDELDCLIVDYVGTGTATYSKMIENFGKFGQTRVDRLISKGVLFENGEKLSLKNSNYFENPEKAIKTSQALANYFNLDSLGSEYSALANLSEGITLDGAKEIKKELSAFLTKTVQIMDNNPGDIPVFLVTLMNSHNNLLKKDVTRV